MVSFVFDDPNNRTIQIQNEWSTKDQIMENLKIQDSIMYVKKLNRDTELQSLC